MSYRIRAAPEVEAWLADLRADDPAAADLVDGALDALREGGAGLGPPRCRVRYERDRGSPG